MKKKFNDNDYFLSGKSNKIVEPRNYQYTFKSILTKCKLKLYKFHILRHTFATNCIEVGIDLGLSNITNITEDTKERHENTEILIMVSENIVNKEETLNSYVSYIETLSTKVFEKSSNTKIGILGIKGTIVDGEKDESGNMILGENDEGGVDGSEDNAEIILKPSSNSDEIIKNFDITFSDKNIDTTELENNKYIEWNIGNLAGNETVNLKYTLKIQIIIKMIRQLQQENYHKLELV